MKDSIETRVATARLRLAGHGATAAQAEIVRRSSSSRGTRAIASLAGFWGLTPIVLLIPPHLPWAVATFGFGTYLAWSSWTGVYRVQSVQGACPRCGNELTVKPGSRIRLPHKIVCFQCHHEPVLELVEEPEAA